MHSLSVIITKEKHQKISHHSFALAVRQFPQVNGYIKSDFSLVWSQSSGLSPVWSQSNGHSPVWSQSSGLDALWSQYLVLHVRQGYPSTLRDRLVQTLPHPHPLLVATYWLDSFFFFFFFVTVSISCFLHGTALIFFLKHLRQF